MGEVFAAENIRTGRPVAVKLLRADSKSKSSAVARFRREARAAGSINSDHVTQVLDVEEDQEHGIVLVFELLAGESLIDRLKRTGPISFDELHAIVEQVWIGLADAHRAGIIHRDLKPSNVFLEQRPDGSTRVKILDFGISKLPKEMGGETLTEMGQSLGTFSFMPPEQINKAKTVDHRADIYACTTLIYQALSGQLPYQARNILAMVELKTRTEPRTLSEALDVPTDPRLEAFLARGLARDPAQRFQTAIEGLSAWRELRPPASQPGPPISAALSSQVSPQPRIPTPPGGMLSVPASMQQHLATAPASSSASVPASTSPSPTSKGDAMASTGSDMARTLARPAPLEQREPVPQTLREPQVAPPEGQGAASSDPAWQGRYTAPSYEPPSRLGPYGTALFDPRTGAPLIQPHTSSSSYHPVPRIYDESSSTGPPSQEKTQIYRPQANKISSTPSMPGGQVLTPVAPVRRRASVYVIGVIAFVLVSLVGFAVVALAMRYWAQK